jgi:hypothetical protein
MRRQLRHTGSMVITRSGFERNGQPAPRTASSTHRRRRDSSMCSNTRQTLIPRPPSTFCDRRSSSVPMQWARRSAFPRCSRLWCEAWAEGFAVCRGCRFSPRTFRSRSSIKKTWPRCCGCVSSAPARPGLQHRRCRCDHGRRRGSGTRPPARTHPWWARRRCGPRRRETAVLALGSTVGRGHEPSGIMDTTKAETELGWRPQHTALESLRLTFR